MIDMRRDLFVSRQYEPKSDFWSQATGNSQLPQGRERHLMIEYKNKIYAMGGTLNGR